MALVSYCAKIHFSSPFIEIYRVHYWTRSFGSRVDGLKPTCCAAEKTNAANRVFGDTNGLTANSKLRLESRPCISEFPNPAFGPQ